ncbi:response regulator [bacterium]|nr:response regulator [bacterium]
MFTKKVLVIDDEYSSHEVLRKQVFAVGCEPLCCSSPRMALQLLRENPIFDLVITDLLMPEMDGRELIAHIRADEQFSELPILMVSGRVSVKEIQDVLQRGGTAFLPKPINSTAFRGAVARLLSLSWASGEVPDYVQVLQEANPNVA